VVHTRSSNGCLRKSSTPCSVLSVKEWSTSGFVVETVPIYPQKGFNFVVAVFPLIVRGGILLLGLVKCLVILQVSFMLFVSKPCKVLCLVSNNSSLIAESISSFRALMRGRSVMSWVLYHCIRSLFLFWIRLLVDAAICIDLNVLVLSGMASRMAVLMVSVRCLAATSISLSRSSSHLSTEDWDYWLSNFGKVSSQLHGKWN
jgi:hypothetical protein